MVKKQISLLLFIFVILALTFAGCGVPKDQYAGLQAQLTSVQKEYDDAKSRLVSAQADIDKLKADVATQSAALNQAKSANDTLQKQAAELQTKLADSTALNTNLQKKSADLEAKLNSILDTKLTQYYKFSYQFVSYDWALAIPLRTYFYYKELPRPSNYSAFVNEPTANSLMEVFSRYIKDATFARNLRKTDVASLITTFTRTLPHNDKDATTPYDSYPRFPVETLIEQGGDSEDVAILAAALLFREGFDIVLLRFDQPKHVAIGINLSAVSGYSWEYQGNRYYYVEPTEKGWDLGDAPLPFRSARPTIVPVTK